MVYNCLICGAITSKYPCHICNNEKSPTFKIQPCNVNDCNSWEKRPGLCKDCLSTKFIFETIPKLKRK